MVEEIRIGDTVYVKWTHRVWSLFDHDINLMDEWQDCGWSYDCKQIRADGTIYTFSKITKGEVPLTPDKVHKCVVL